MYNRKRLVFDFLAEFLDFTSQIFDIAAQLAQNAGQLLLRSIFWATVVPLASIFSACWAIVAPPTTRLTLPFWSTTIAFPPRTITLWFSPLSIGSATFAIGRTRLVTTRGTLLARSLGHGRKAQVFFQLANLLHQFLGQICFAGGPQIVGGTAQMV